MTEDTALKIIVAVYFFTISFILFYGIDIVLQHLTQGDINWTKYISSAFSHAIMIEPYDQVIELGPEKFDKLDENWKAKLKKD